MKEKKRINKIILKRQVSQIQVLVENKSLYKLEINNYTKNNAKNTFMYE